MTSTPGGVPETPPRPSTPSARDRTAAPPSTRRAARAAPAAAPVPRWAVLLPALLLLAMAVAGFTSRGVTAPLDAGADAHVFSAQRAQQAVAPIVAEPRPSGTAANDRAHEELAAQLAELGFETRSEEGIGSRVHGEEASAGYVRNLVAVRPGTDPTGTVVLATHLDSVPGAPGAGDAGVGLAVILESVRALGPEALRNDLVVLLVDGEERGLLGAEAFLAAHPEDLTSPVVVLNHEARGVSGRPLITRTAGPMHEVLPASPRPEFESFTDALFAIIPNDTDFTEYRAGGWWGMDMAIIDDSWAYHSAQDDAAHLDPATLQHYGELTLALTRDLAARDLEALAAHADETPVQTTAPWGIVRIGQGTLQALAVLSPLAVLGAAVLRRRRGEVTARGVLGGSAMMLLALVAGTLGAFALWSLTAGATPRMLSQTMREPVRAEPFLVAELLAGAAIALTGWVLARLCISRSAALLGAALLVTALLAPLGVHSPLLGGAMVLPAAVAAAGTLLATVLTGAGARARVPALVVRCLAVLPTGWMLGAQLSTLAEFGIASAAGSLAGTVLVGVGAAAALLNGGPAPASASASTSVASSAPCRRRRRLLAPVAPAAAALALAVAGTAWTLAAPEPTQERVTAHVDADGRTLWETSGSTAWGRALHGMRGRSDLEVPTVTWEDSPGGSRIVIDAPRDGAALTLRADGGLLRDVAVDGVPIRAGTRAVLADGGLDAGAGGGRRAEGLDAVTVHGVRAGQRVVLTAQVPAGTALTVVETSFDPSPATGWTAPGEEVSLLQPRLEVTVEVAP